MPRKGLTFKGLVELALAEDDAQVVHGAGVELHPEYHVPGGAAETLVVALQLQGGGGGTRVTSRQNYTPCLLAGILRSVPSVALLRLI